MINNLDIHSLIIIIFYILYFININNMSKQDPVQMSLVLFTLLRMFYLNNQSDVYIQTVKDIIKDYPIVDSRAWVENLITQIQSLPTLGPLQSQKTTYVCDSLLQYLDSVEQRLSVGLPQF